MDSQINIFDLIYVNFDNISIDARPYQFDELVSRVLSYHTTCPKCNQRVDIPISKMKNEYNINYVFCEVCNFGLNKWNSINDINIVECKHVEQESDDIILLDDIDFDAVMNQLSDIENKYTRFINE